MYLLIAAFADRRAELGLADGTAVRAERGWPVERDLARFLLPKIQELLAENGLKLADLGGLGVFAGPAAFTDLRIVHAVANALAYGLGIPVVKRRRRGLAGRLPAPAGEGRGLQNNQARLRPAGPNHQTQEVGAPFAEFGLALGRLSWYNGPRKTSAEDSAPGLARPTALSVFGRFSAGLDLMI